MKYQLYKNHVKKDEFEKIDDPHEYVETAICKAHDTADSIAWYNAVATYPEKYEGKMLGYVVSRQEANCRICVMEVDSCAKKQD